jgi:lipoprotein-releasing system permease protein
MFSPIERMIAYRYLRSERKEGFISVIAGFSLVGIALGVATLIIVMAVMNGFRKEITSKILGFGGHIKVASYERVLANYDHFVEALQKIDGVETVMPVIDGQVMALSKYANVGAMVKGVRPSDLPLRPLLMDNLTLGSDSFFEGKDKIVLGLQLATHLGVGVGEQLTLISPQSNATALGSMPRLKRYTVVGLFDTGMYEYDNNVILMPFEAAQIFFKFPDAAAAIEITVKDPDGSAELAEKIYHAFNGVYQGDNWQDMNASLFNALQVERTVMFLILTLIVFIAAFNIVSMLIMMVNDKSKDIGVLRTMGMSRGSIGRIFFLSGSLLGGFGTLLGFLLGLGFSLNIESIRKFFESLLGTTLFDPVVYFLSELPADVQFSDVMWSVSMGLFFSFVATLYPAFKASRQDPAEVLRYE